MHPDACRSGVRRLFVACGRWWPTDGGHAAEEPLSVTYGPAALDGRRRPGLPRDHLPERAGHDHRPPVFARVRCRYRRRVRHALRRRLEQPRCATRCMAARVPPTPPPVPSTAKATKQGRRPTPPARRSPAASAGQTVRLGENAGCDDAWQTLASLLPEQGDHVGGRYVFRLEVTGLAGNDGNAFTATLEHARPPRRPARRPGNHRLRADGAHPRQDPRHRDGLRDPGGCDRASSIHNFDAASGQVAFASTYRTVPLAASGQDEWRESTRRAAARGARHHGARSSPAAARRSPTT